ncbi:hypothetical protein Ndes2526B_g07839 [Nannochloris sp. 'desiccata']|nr:hypothetical protein KSW81_002501 [Chlorella desiccata (nom. nud.)]
MSSYQPAAGISYPIVLGESFKNRLHSADYSTLRLDFIPASCDRSSPGNLHIDPDNKAATLSLDSTNTKASNDKVEFQGKFDLSRDDLDCVAIFNAEMQTFRLELLNGGQATLRHMPGSKRDKGVGNKNKDVGADKAVQIPDKEKNTAQGNASLPAAAAAAVLKIRKPVTAKVSQDKEDIADDFFHGALD